MKFKTALLIILIIILGVQIFYVSAQIYFNLVLKGFGSVNVRTVGVEAYSDLNCTKPVLEINWEKFDPGQTKTIIIYLKSTSNTNTTLTLTTSNWSPQNASKYITLSWSYKNTTIQPQEVLEVQFTLHVAYSITGITDFSFDIIITAVEITEPVVNPNNPGVFSLTPLDDSWIAGTYFFEKDKNFGSNPFIAVGRDAVGPYRGLISFNLTNFTTKTITSAILKLYYYSYFSTYANPFGRQISLYKNLQSWNEKTVTWNNAPTFDTTKTCSLITPNNFGWLEFNVTNDIKYWLTGGLNYGWTIKFTDENAPDSIMYFYTKESATFPILEIITSD